VLATGSWHGEILVSRKDGRRVAVDLRVTLVRDAAGRPVSRLSIGTDITENKKLEERFLEVQRHEAIGTLASGLAHDLNNILTPVLLVTGLLNDKIQEADDRAMLGMIEASAQRGARIVQQLLTYSRGAQGERVSVAVKHLIKEMVSVARETFPRNISVIEHTDAELWSVIADATQIHQVLMNLCINARDAMPAGGQLRIVANNVELAAGDLRLGATASPGFFMHLEVRDTGMGITPEIIDKIFEPFFTTKAIGVGSGLGLSSVLGIVRGHGGHVSVESIPGRGTTFHAYLPAERGSTEASTVAPTANPAVAHGEMILVVDDEAVVLRMLQFCLERSGYRVVTAENGQAAMIAFVQHQQEIKLVLTDLMMPLMGGEELAKALHHLDPEMRIIAFSGLEAVEAPGIVELLEKPYTFEALVAAVARHLPRPEA